MKPYYLRIIYFLILLSSIGKMNAQVSCPAGQARINLYTGYGKNYTVNNTSYVGNGDHALGMPDEVHTVIKDNTNPSNRGIITIDLGENIPNLDTIYYVASAQDDNSTSWDVSTSADGITFTAVSGVSYSTNVFNTFSHIINNAGGARYIRFASTSSSKEIRLDAIFYNKKACRSYCISNPITYEFGYAVDFLSKSTAKDPIRATLAPNFTSFSKLENNTTDELFLDFGEVVPFGTTVQLFLAADAAGTVANFSVTGSVDDISYSNAQSFVSNSVQPVFVDYYYNVTQPFGIRYLRIVTTTAVKGDIDAVQFMFPTYWGKNYISGYLFSDANSNGIKDGVETGVSGITVNLSKDLNNDGTFDSGDEILQTTATIAGGAYQFSIATLDTNYLISIVPSTLPLGNSLTTSNLQTVNFSNFNNTSCNKNFGYATCPGNCPPVATDDYDVSFMGSSNYISVLINDYDPNNNLNISSLNVIKQPRIGSVLISNGVLIYTPISTGLDTIIYRIADLSAPTPLWDTAIVVISVFTNGTDACSDAKLSHTYYIPAPEQDLYTAFGRADCRTVDPLTDSFRTFLSIKCQYPGTVLYFDHWEDGYESVIMNPTQSTTQVWGDGDPFNGIAPGYSDDIIPTGGSIITNNTMFVRPRNSSQFYYDAKDKIYSSTDIALSRISWEAQNRKEKQAYSTDVYDVNKFGTSFTIPVGNYTGSNADFQYTALFVRASENNTTISIDSDNNGVVDMTATLQEGNSYFLNGGVRAGATVTSTKPVGVDVFFGDSLYCWNAKELNVLPAQFYGSTYYSAVPTTTTTDTAVVMLYNLLSNSITINWNTPSTSGSFNIGGNSVFRFPLGASGYRFRSAGGERYVANQLIDSWRFGVTPSYSGPNNNGGDFDWAYALIPEERLTPFGSIAWAPGSSDLSANGNPVWVMPTTATTIYVKWDGNITGSTGLTSPCGFKYDIAYSMTSLEVRKLLDADNDQSGVAVYNCSDVKLAMVYGEDPSLCTIGFPYIDAGTSIQPFCISKFLMANDDFAITLTNTPVTISVMNNDTGFNAILDRSSISITNMLKPSNGTIALNSDGTLLYTPNNGFTGYDTLKYLVCSTPSVVCDEATVVIKISSCPAQFTKNLITGQVFSDVNKDGVNNDGGTGHFPAKVYLYTDGNCNSTIDPNELADSVSINASGRYQFVTYPMKTISDDFEGTGGASSCASGSDGNTPWASNWVDSLDVLSVGFCFSPPATAANTDVEIIKDGSFSNGIRLKDRNRLARRNVNLSGATGAFLSFSYRRKSNTLVAGEDVLVQASSNGTTYTTLFTITGNGLADAGYVKVFNLNLLPYASANTVIRFLTNNNVDDGDTVYIDNISIKYLKYNQCFITRLDTLSSVPVNFYSTTATQYSFTATSASTCLSNYDFGVVKRSITISGTLYNDINGNSDGFVNGTAFDNPSGATVYVYLIGPNGKVAFKDTLNSGNGTYAFTKANVMTTYTVLITTTNANVGANAPSVVLPNKWGSTGEAYGTNNSAGSGNESGTANSVITVTTGLLNVTGVNFGIQKPDAGTDRATCYFYGQNSVTVIANTTPGTWLQKYDNPGTATITSPNAASTTITNFTEEGIYNFVWTNGVVSDTATVIVSRPSAGIDVSLCGAYKGQLDGNYDLGTWSAMAGNPSGATLGSTINGVADINYLSTANGNYNFIYTVNGCPDTVKQVLSPKPAAGIASSTLYSCTYQQSYIGQLTAPGPSPSTGVWSIISGPGTITNPTDSVTTIGSLSQTGDSTFVRWVITDVKGCKDTSITKLKPVALDTTLISKYAKEFCLTCPVQNNGMSSYYDLNGKLLARVTDSADAVSIGNTTFCGQLTYPVAGDPNSSHVQTVTSWIEGAGFVPQPYLPRAWNMNTTTDAPMTVNLYFTDQELAALTGKSLENGGYFDFGGDANRLLLVAYPNNSDTFIPAASPNGIVSRPQFQKIGNVWQVTFSFSQSATFYLYPPYWAAYYGLPVELIDLKATPEVNYIQVDWETASELNCLKFEVERCDDNKSFKKIGEVAGAGNSKEFRKYNFDDSKVEPEKLYYYRLNQIDTDGKSNKTKVVAAMIKDKNKVTISEFMPNPASKSSRVKIKSSQPLDVNIKIFTVDGNLINQEFYSISTGESDINLEFSNLAQGLYLIQFNYNDNMEMRKLILK